MQAAERVVSRTGTTMSSLQQAAPAVEQSLAPEAPSLVAEVDAELTALAEDWEWAVHTYLEALITPPVGHGLPIGTRS